MEQTGIRRRGGGERETEPNAGLARRDEARAKGRKKRKGKNRREGEREGGSRHIHAKQSSVKWVTSKLPPPQPPIPIIRRARKDSNGRMKKQ